MARGAMAELAERVRKSDPAAAGRALTCVIDERDGYEELSRRFFSCAGRSHKVGLCGPPGGGKSTLVSRLVARLRRAGEKVGVLAVDPTSPFTGGAFLGDRLRVQEHALDPGVFMRSLGSRGMMGGVNATIFGAIHVLEAYGCDRILVETVGTGQDEVEISRVADTVIYVTTPFLGDEIQAMKAGAMEAADLFVVNKCDLPGADKAVASLRAALEPGARVRAGWKARATAVSAQTGEGVPALCDALQEHREFLARDPEGEARARAQLREELTLFVQRRLHKDALGKISDAHIDSLRAKSIDPITLGEELMKKALRARSRR